MGCPCFGLGLRWTTRAAWLAAVAQWAATSHQVDGARAVCVCVGRTSGLATQYYKSVYTLLVCKVVLCGVSQSCGIQYSSVCGNLAVHQLPRQLHSLCFLPVLKNVWLASWSGTVARASGARSCSSRGSLWHFWCCVAGRPLADLCCQHQQPCISHTVIF